MIDSGRRAYFFPLPSNGAGFDPRHAANLCQSLPPVASRVVSFPGRESAWRHGSNACASAQREICDGGCGRGAASTSRCRLGTRSLAKSKAGRVTGARLLFRAAAPGATRTGSWAARWLPVMFSQILRFPVGPASRVPASGHAFDLAAPSAICIRRRSQLVLTGPLTLRRLHRTRRGLRSRRSCTFSCMRAHWFGKTLGWFLAAIDRCFATDWSTG